MNKKLFCLIKNEKENLKLYNRIQTSFKLINNDIFFNFNNLNVYDKYYNVINNI